MLSIQKTGPSSRPGLDRSGIVRRPQRTLNFAFYSRTVKLVGSWPRAKCTLMTKANRTASAACSGMSLRARPQSMRPNSSRSCIATIQDEERQQIALELHDSTAQHLVAAGLNMMTVQSHLPADATIHELCNEVERSLDDATKELRTYSYLLIPPQLAKDGLEAAMRSYVDGFARRTTLETELRISPQAEELPLPSQRALLRVVQEALANVRRHASASRVAITIKCVSDRVHLLVSDNGKGIKGASNGQLCETLRSGVGIPGMTARLRRLGGDLRIKSGTDGTTLHGVILAREKPQPRWARPARI